MRSVTDGRRRCCNNIFWAAGKSGVGVGCTGGTACLRQGKELRVALRDGRAALVVPALAAPSPARRAARGPGASAAAILHPI